MRAGMLHIFGLLAGAGGKPKHGHSKKATRQEQEQQKRTPSGQGYVMLHAGPMQVSPDSHADTIKKCCSMQVDICEHYCIAGSLLCHLWL